MTREILPVIKLEGSPEQIGLAHGQILRDRIHDCFAFYTRQLFKNPNFDFEKHGRLYLEAIGNFSPAFETEIRALARGAGMEPWQIAVLNARSEIFLQASAEFIHQCTSLYFEEQKLLGQTWDWMSSCEDFMVLLDITLENGLRILTLSEAGIIGKIGFNSKGLGVCLNILFGKKPVDGVPIHILLRSVLESQSLEEARRTLNQASFGCYSNMLIGDASGGWFDYEFAGKSLKEAFYSSKPPAHTNHYLASGEMNEDTPHLDNSVKRFDKARQLSGLCEEQTVEAMKKILTDPQGGEDAICKRHTPFFEGLEHGTICSLVMDLPKREMHITHGSPYHHNFIKHAMN